MLNEKYKQNVYFWGLLGAILGIIDGIFISIIYNTSLNNLFLKLGYIVYSLNFYMIVGVIAGFIFAVISTQLMPQRVKKFFLIIFLTGSIFIYFGFYINLFRINFNQPIVYSLLPWKFSTTDLMFKNIIDEILLLPFSLLTALLLCRFYKKIPSIICTKQGVLPLLLCGAVLVNLIIWIAFGQAKKAEANFSSATFNVPDEAQTKNDLSNFTPPKNLLVIVMDTLRADHLSCYGYPKKTSPFIDKLSKKGVLFENATAQAPLTSPSIASLFTGLYVNEHGVHGCWTVLPNECFTLAESYLKQGFATQSFVANCNVSSTFNYNQGFNNCTLSKTDLGISEKAIKWLEQNRETPFFLYLHYMGSHSKYTPPKEFDVFTPDMKNSPLVDNEDIFDGSLLGDHNELDYYISKYDGEILLTDYLIDKLFDKIKQYGLLENTLIILTADHGESLGDHGYFFNHGIFPYDTCSRVPFILYYKNGNFPAKRIQQQIELIDLYPTVHEIMNMYYDRSKISGKSFLPLLLGKKQPHKNAFTQSGKIILESARFSTFYAIRDKDWKLIYNSWWPDTQQLFSFNFIANIYRKTRLVFSAGFFPKKQRYELYNLQKDPQETRNLYKPDNPIALSLIRELNHKIYSGNKKFVRRNKDALDQKTKKTLKSLGYL